MDQAILLIYAVTWAVGVLLPFIVLCTYRTCCAKLRSFLPNFSRALLLTFNVFLRGIPLEDDEETVNTISV